MTGLFIKELDIFCMRVDVVRERTVCFDDYIVSCTNLQDRELFSVDIGMKEDLRTKKKF